MRIVIDMQGAQTDSRFRGIGRYTLSLALAMARTRGEHEIMLALNGLFADTIESIRAAFDGLIPQENIRVWTTPGPVREADPANHARREVAERIREAFLASLCPDVVLVSTLFEGLGDDAVTSVGILDRDTPTVVFLYDLFTLINPDGHYRTSKLHQEFFARKVSSLERSQRLLAISNSARQEAISVLSYPAQNIINISCACDTAFRQLNLSDAQKNHLFDKYHILRPFVMYTGGADERKNLSRLIETYSLLPESVREIYQLVIVGKMWENDAKALVAIVQKHGLSSNDVVMTGYVEDDDLVKLYNSCALFIFPSLHEGFGIPPLEAMRCGAPVIAADATSLPEVIGRSDALFDPYSVESIREKLERALTDEEFRSDLAAHGLIHATKFSWDESARRAIEALESFAPPRPLNIVSALHIDKTSIFRKIRKRILLIKLDHMGDFVLSIPAIAKLRARYPHASIDIVVGSWNVAIAASLKIFNNIHTFDYFKKKSNESPSMRDLELAEILEKLSDYDIAIDLRRQHETRFLLLKTQAKLKVGYDTYDPAINARLDIRIPIYPDVAFEKTILNSTPTSKQILALIDVLPSDVNDYLALPEITEQIISDASSVAIFPLAGGSVRDWEKANYLALVELLQHDARINSINIYFGSANESAGFEFKVSDKLNIHAGLEFQDLAKSVSTNSVCVSNNSFGAHFGAYLGLTVIAIYSGHETPDEWAPAFGDSYVIHTAESCSPCHQGRRSDCAFGLSCLTSIKADFVYNRIMEAIDSRVALNGNAGEGKAVSISLNKGYRDVANELIASIANSKEAQTPEGYADIARAISRNHPPQARSKQLLIDISEISRSDSGTGIQRVVRSIVAELLANSLKGYKVEPVYATPGGHGYRYARGYTSRLLGGGSPGADDLVEAYNGDVFLGVDLNYAVATLQNAQLQDWYRNGVKVFFVVYDLLPVLLPHRFLENAEASHRAWLESISHFDGAICISRAVADELHDWLRVFGPKRKRPFSVSWFHLGADMGNVVPSKGMPDNVDKVLAALKSQPSFLMVGTLEPRKGHAQVLAAFESLWRDDVSANLVIVGKSGWMVDMLVQKLHGHEKYGKCLFWFEGISDEYLEKIYASSTCLIVASEGEGFGLPIIEAAQHALPVIARDLPVFREVAGEHALYFADEGGPEVVEAAIRDWLGLYLSDKNPRSDAIQWLTWRESASRMFGAVMNQRPYYKWLPVEGFHYWGNDPRLHTRGGVRFGKSIRAAAKAGCLLYGPNAALSAGRYCMTLHGSASQWTGGERLDIVADQGRTLIQKTDLKGLTKGKWLHDVEFILDTGVTDFEFRMYVDDHTEVVVDGVQIVLLDDSNFVVVERTARLPWVNVGKQADNIRPSEVEAGPSSR